jgi:hypothetical protein
VARPILLTRARHERIVELLREGVPFATACRRVGISSSAGYEWLYRGWGKHPTRPMTRACVAFARDVDAVFPGGFAERYADDELPDEEFAEAAVHSEQGENNEAHKTPQQDEREHADCATKPSTENTDGFADRFSDTEKKEPRRSPFVWRSRQGRAGAMATEGLEAEEF